MRTWWDSRIYIYVYVGGMYLRMRDGRLGRGFREWASGSEFDEGNEGELGGETDEQMEMEMAKENIPTR